MGDALMTVTGVDGVSFPWWAYAVGGLVLLVFLIRYARL